MFADVQPRFGQIVDRSRVYRVDIDRTPKGVRSFNPWQVLNIGVACRTPEEREVLRSRTLVSGMRVLDPESAELAGYVRTDIIEPTVPHAPADEELRALTAHNFTDIHMQLCRLPLSLFQEALRVTRQTGFRRNYRDVHLIDRKHDVEGTYIEHRVDAPRLLCASVNLTRTNPLTRAPAKVGVHIDMQQDPFLRFIVMNGGPGPRWHVFSPTLTRNWFGNRLAVGDHVYGPQRTPEIQDLAHAKRAARVRRLLTRPPDPCSASLHRLFWLRLDPPSYDVRLRQYAVDALVNVPVPHTLHDASTLFSAEASTVAYYATYTLGEDVWPSALKR
jgi:hypothetical protein